MHSRFKGGLYQQGLLTASQLKEGPLPSEGPFLKSLLTF